jgi:hypothetical protein
VHYLSAAPRTTKLEGLKMFVVVTWQPVRREEKRREEKRRGESAVAELHY